ncbi:MAG: Photosystem protein Psb27 [Cyanobacteriota bacterium]|jgi:photosystem II Psb27 protein|uniref:photosystem II protein Psb27 n=2 Tax=Synechococcus TaxID=1129 RepID=UPI003137D515
MLPTKLQSLLRHMQNQINEQLIKPLLSFLLIGCLALGLTACGESASGLTGSYVDDTMAVAEALITTISTPAEGPERANQQRDARALINSYIALYRPNSSVNGLASFTTMQTALNSLAGHYASYANRPLPEALVKRLDKELHKAETSVTRGS